MCAITGIYYFKGKPVDQNLLLAMTGTMAHRGPDDQGIYLDGNVGLGHRRLSIIDLSAAGHQPMENQNKTLAIVFNGEIYNFKELRRQLEALGHRFVSHSDTEVLLASYAAWGAACLQKINGMFAFAIYDKQKQQLFLARDRMGEKPLYYYADEDKLVFASEIKAILQDSSIARKLNPQGMVNYFTFGHSIAPDTMYAGIKKLLPGHAMVVSHRGINVKAYWELAMTNTHDQGRQYYQSSIRERFLQSVQDRLISDVPLGVFLSGGLDSSSVVAAMAKQR